MSKPVVLVTPITPRFVDRIEKKDVCTANRGDADAATPAPLAVKATNTRSTAPPTSDGEDNPHLLVSSPQHFSLHTRCLSGPSAHTRANTTESARETIVAGRPIRITDGSVGSASFLLSSRLKPKLFCGGRLVTDVAAVHDVDMTTVDLCDLPALDKI